jgi:hypothetical protein
MRGHVRKRRTWESVVDMGPHPTTRRRRQKSKSDSITEEERGLHQFIRYVGGGGDPFPERIRNTSGLGASVRDPGRVRGVYPPGDRAGHRRPRAGEGPPRPHPRRPRPPRMEVSQSPRRGGRNSAQPPASRNTAAMKKAMNRGLVGVDAEHLLPSGASLKYPGSATDASRHS